MEPFSGLGEVAEVSEVKGGGKKEFSRGAEAKFAKLMGDDEIGGPSPDLEEGPPLGPEERAAKFAKLFGDADAGEEGRPPERLAEREQGLPAPMKADDGGRIYLRGGRLEPNTAYELKGSRYSTDERGRIVRCEARPQLSPENPRDLEAQRLVGGGDRRFDDQGGHIVGRDMGGDGGAGNLVAMDPRINQSDYKRMENAVKEILADGGTVTSTTEISYSGTSHRPDRLTTTVTADARDTVYKFDNNMDGSLRGEVPEGGRETVQDRLQETGGEISSIKEEYDGRGRLNQVTVYITYRGEDGANYRTGVVIDKVEGGRV